MTRFIYKFFLLISGIYFIQLIFKFFKGPETPLNSFEFLKQNDVLSFVLFWLMIVIPFVLIQLNNPYALVCLMALFLVFCVRLAFKKN